jgi:enoyl-CoA hydratase/carnithine racemase
MVPHDGFCGISQRHGKKPILAAVNGLAVGGGMEVLINCDTVIASPSAILSLPTSKSDSPSSAAPFLSLFERLADREPRI